MKTYLILSLVLSFTSFSQEDSCAVYIEFPEVEAEFPGGLAELQRFILDHLNYSEAGMDFDLGDCSRLYLEFIVCADGRIQSLPPHEKNCEAFKGIGIDLVDKMPNWIPAQERGMNVASKIRLPVIIDFY